MAAFLGKKGESVRAVQRELRDLARASLAELEAEKGAEAAASGGRAAEGRKRSRELQVWLDVEVGFMPAPMKESGEVELTLRGRFSPGAMEAALEALLHHVLAKLREAQATAGAKVEVQTREREARERALEGKEPVCWFWKLDCCKFAENCTMLHRLHEEEPETSWMTGAARCARCGCGAARDALGDRVCWCDACQGRECVLPSQDGEEGSPRRNATQDGEEGEEEEPGKAERGEDHAEEVQAGEGGKGNGA